MNASYGNSPSTTNQKKSFRIQDLLDEESSIPTENTREAIPRRSSNLAKKDSSYEERQEESRQEQNSNRSESPSSSENGDTEFRSQFPSPVLNINSFVPQYGLRESFGSHHGQPQHFETHTMPSGATFLMPNMDTESMDPGTLGRYDRFSSLTPGETLGTNFIPLGLHSSFHPSLLAQSFVNHPFDLRVQERNTFLLNRLAASSCKF